MEEQWADVPKGVTVETLLDGLRISWPTLGKRWKSFLLALVAVSILFVTLSLGIGWFRGLISGQSHLGDCVAPLMFVPLAFVVTYFTAVGLFNKSVIEIDQGLLGARCRPIPYTRTRAISIANVRQIYVAPKVKRGRYNLVFYELRVFTKDGEHEKLVEVEDDELALYLEQEIERFLSIPDEVVRGEWRPEPYLWER